MTFFKRIVYLMHHNLKYGMDGDQVERLPQEGECREDSKCDILDAASEVARGVLKEIEALAGTTSCKSVQLVRLRRWAEEQGCWFKNRSRFGDFFDRGSENETYLSANGSEIIKLNDFRYSDDNLTPFFERVKTHNQYFPDCAYKMIGLAENRDGNVCAVIVQPYVDDARHPFGHETGKVGQYALCHLIADSCRLHRLQEVRTHQLPLKTVKIKCKFFRVLGHDNGCRNL